MRRQTKRKSKFDQMYCTELKNTDVHIEVGIGASDSQPSLMTSLSA